MAKSDKGWKLRLAPSNKSHKVNFLICIVEVGRLAFFGIYYPAIQAFYSKKSAKHEIVIIHFFAL